MPFDDFTGGCAERHGQHKQQIITRKGKIKPRAISWRKLSMYVVVLNIELAGFSRVAVDKGGCRDGFRRAKLTMNKCPGLWYAVRDPTEMYLHPKATGQGTEQQRESERT
jgi:hypothetical protein